MKKSFSLFLISIVLLSGSAYSAEKIKLTVLPFEVQPEETFAYLKTQIPEMISKQLEKDGAIALNPDAVFEPGWQKEITAIDRMRELGKKAGVAFILWGNLRWEEQRYAIELKALDLSASAPPETFSGKGEGIENLHVTLLEVTRKFSVKILKLEKIEKLVVEGNKRIEDDAILKVIKTKPGEVYSPQTFSEDLKAIYAMGYFDDIRIETERGPEGKIIIYKVTEKPTIRKIRFKGNKVFDEKELTEDGLTISTGSILNIFKINSDIKRIEDLYRNKNYHNVKVTDTIHPLKNNQADLEFEIEEGKKIRIKEIIFEGNSAYPAKKLLKIMKTKEKGFFSWLTSSGDLNTEDLNQDIMKITSLYYINGYIQARVSEPQIDYKGDWIYLKIKIEEGPQFKVGKVDIEGDLILSKEELLRGLHIGQEKFCNRKVLQDDVIALTDIYQDEGYFNVDVAPRIDKNLEDLVADITFVIRKGTPVYFDKIIITGNNKTRDKVIRRELNVYEQELYGGARLKRGIRNLHRLDYFEDIKVNTVKGSTDDKVNLDIEVVEKPTGMFTFGAGYSSVEHVFGTVSVSQRNLFGRGQTLTLKAEAGGTTNTYQLSFQEPWLFDIPLSAGFSVYNQEKEYNTYDRDKTGGSIFCSYPVFDYTRVYLSYSYEIGDIKNIDELYASEAVKELAGRNTTSSVSTSLQYDSKDKIYNATEGSEYSISIEQAGGPFGGDIAFTKYIAEAGWYVPLHWSFIGFAHTKAGLVKENGSGKLPDYERFYLGGMNSLRGYDWQDITPKDLPGDPYGVEMGGDKMVQFNFELLRPIFKESGLVLVLFYDMGNAYDDYEKIDLNDLRESYGYGVRWYSPIGPIRLEYGRIVNPRENEDSNGNWEFTMGTPF